MAVATVADEIEDDIFMELLSKFEGELNEGGGREGIVSVDMENGQTEGFAGGSAVAGGTGVIGQGGESNLVIDDDVDGAAGAVAFEAGEVDGFGDDALPDESAVAVNEKRDDFFPFDGVMAVALTGAGLALDDGVDGFEVAGIGGKGKVNFLAGGGGDLVLVAKVIFDVAIPENGFRNIVFMKFGEEFTAGFAEGVDEDIEATTVGHADDYFFDPGSGASLDQRIEHGDESFAAFKREAFLTDIAGVEEAFEGFGGDYFLEEAALLGGGEGGLVAGAFHAIAKPAANGKVHNVHELDSDMVAVGLFEEGEDFAEGAGAAPAEGAGVENGIEIGFG